MPMNLLTHNNILLNSNSDNKMFVLPDLMIGDLMVIYVILDNVPPEQHNTVINSITLDGQRANVIEVSKGIWTSDQEEPNYWEDVAGGAETLNAGNSLTVTGSTYVAIVVDFKIIPSRVYVNVGKEGTENGYIALSSIFYIPSSNYYTQVQIAGQNILGTSHEAEMSVNIDLPIKHIDG